MYIVSDDSINNQEQKGRNIFLSIFSGMTWTENQEKFGVWDTSGTTKTTAMFCEIKARKLKSNDYGTTYLEVKKYSHLMELANSVSNGKAFYFVSYQDGKSYLYDLKNIKDIEMYRDKKWMLEVSLEGQTTQVLKDVYELPLWRKLPGLTIYK